MTLSKLYKAAAAVVVGLGVSALPVFETEIEGTAEPDCNMTITWVLGEVEERDRYYSCKDDKMPGLWLTTDTDRKFYVTMDEPVSWTRDEHPFEPGQRVKVSFNSSVLDKALDGLMDGIVKAGTSDEEYKYIYSDSYGLNSLTVKRNQITPQ